VCLLHSRHIDFGLRFLPVHGYARIALHVVRGQYKGELNRVPIVIDLKRDLISVNFPRQNGELFGFAWPDRSRNVRAFLFEDKDGRALFDSPSAVVILKLPDHLPDKSV
jgi:hypothetical protein